MSIDYQFLISKQYCFVSSICQGAKYAAKCNAPPWNYVIGLLFHFAFFSFSIMYLYTSICLLYVVMIKIHNECEINTVKSINQLINSNSVAMVLLISWSRIKSMTPLLFQSIFKWTNAEFWRTYSTSSPL